MQQRPIAMVPVLDVVMTCGQCQAKELHVYVPVRGADQDVVDWVQNVCAVHVAEAHRAFSPHCTATAMDDLKIPLSELGVGFLP